MSKNVMITLKRERTDIERIKIMQWFLDTDCKKWILAEETGNLGYKHWQIRFSSRYDLKTLRFIFGINAHIEECSDVWDYEKKEGKYYTSDDNPYKLQVRFGTMTETQKKVLAHADQQNDREITVWYEEKGRVGKTWFAMHLAEIGKGFYVPPILNKTQAIIQWVASGYKGEEYVLVDIPRNAKWSDELMIALEMIKDGWSFDTRYSAKLKIIRGVKVIVLTNGKPKLNKLSQDRWDILNEAGEPLS